MGKSRVTRLAALIAAAGLVVGAPAAATAQVRPMSTELQVVDAELKAVDDSLAWVNRILAQADGGALIMLRYDITELEALSRVFVPVNREDFAAAVRMSVGLGEMTPAEAADVIRFVSGTSVRSVARLREIRASLIEQRATLQTHRAGLLAPPPRPAAPPVSRPPEPKVLTCVAEGVWGNRIKAGSSTWTIAADGTATESGMGNARGTGGMSGDTLVITWRTGAVAGVYRIDVFSDCSGGDGEVTFSDGPPGFDRSPQAAEFTRISGPSGGVPKN